MERPSRGEQRDHEQENEIGKTEGRLRGKSAYRNQSTLAMACLLAKAGLEVLLSKGLIAE